MTRDQFDNLKIGDKVKFNKVAMKYIADPEHIYYVYKDDILTVSSIKSDFLYANTVISGLYEYFNLVKTNIFIGVTCKKSK